MSTSQTTIDKKAPAKKRAEQAPNGNSNNHDPVPLHSNFEGLDDFIPRKSVKIKMARQAHPDVSKQKSPSASQVPQSEQKLPEPTEAMSDEKPSEKVSLQDLFDAINQGDESAQQRLDDLLKASPQVKEEISDLTRTAQKTLLEKFIPGNAALKRMVLDHYDELRKELSQPKNLEAIEKLLVKELVAGKLQLDCLDSYFCSNAFTSSKDAALAIATSSRAHSRLMKTVRTLACLRATMN
jgi:hypothetical protein